VTRRLGSGKKAAWTIAGGALTVVLLCCGGAAVIGTVTGNPERAGSESGEQSPAAETTRASAATESATSPAPTVEKRNETETQEIPFETTTVQDSHLAKGTEQVRTKGVPGIKTLTYEVTLTNGVRTDRKLIGETVTKAAVAQVVAVGTKVVVTKAAPTCDPNYSGACVPIASDVDCAGGSGNGPAYVSGPVRVIGTDIYGLDADGDGVGCE
jgi:hypothetical protein